MNKKGGIGLILIIVVALIAGSTFVIHKKTSLTEEEKIFKDNCEESGGTFIKCSGTQKDSFLGSMQGSCSPEGALKCYCPIMKGLTNEGDICVKKT